MPAVTLNNNQVASVVNAAIAQSTGGALDDLDLVGIIDKGNDSSVIGSVENFTKSLLNVMIGNWFTDESYRSNYTDPFFQDSETYGAISRFISVEVPDVVASHAWTDITSGTTTAGVYTLYLPVVHEQIYGKTVSYELPIAITGEQWDTAFHSASELSSFVNYIFLVVDNMLVKHLQDMDALNRANFMAEKINYANSVGATGIHVINLVESWANASGATADITVEDFLNDRKALNYAKSEIIFYKDMMSQMSTLFNTAGYKRFVPEDKLVIQTLARFDQALAYAADSDTYHNEILTLPQHQTVPYWQAQSDANGSLTFDATSSIDVVIEHGTAPAPDTEIQQSGIVCFMCHQWAIMHTLFKRRVAVQHFDAENIDQYFYQFRDGYMNNLTMPALIFVLEDWTAPEDGGGEG